jgi:hypothetical protein
VSAYTHRGECSTLDPCLRCKEFGETQERAHIIALLGSDKAYSLFAYHIYGQGHPQELANDLVALIEANATEIAPSALQDLQVETK